jgi:AcrR family transcriptional regulator
VPTKKRYPTNPSNPANASAAIPRSSEGQPRRDRGRPRGAAVVERVLAATLTELARVGMEGLAVDEVAKLALVNKTSVYRRWPTREALVAAALSRVLDGAVAQFPDTGSLEGDLLALLTPIMQMISESPGRALLRAAFSESASGAVAALAAQSFTSQSANPLHAMVERAQRRGEWRDNVQADQLVSMLVGAVIHRAMLEHAPLSAEWLASLVDLVLYGAVPRA